MSTDNCMLDSPVTGDLSQYHVEESSAAGAHNLNRCVACGHRMGKAKGEDPASAPINDLCPGCHTRNGEPDPWNNDDYM